MGLVPEYKTNLAQLRSHVGMVFQHFELFPHLSIIHNLVLAQEKVLKYQIEQADAAKKYLIDNGLQVSQLEDEDVWKKAAMEKVWPEMADFVGGKETINAYLKACGKPLWK